MEIEDDPYLSCAGAHAIAVMTEWDVFKTLDLQKIYDAMQKPAFIFDGRDVIDHAAARKIGFEVWAVGKSRAAKPSPTSSDLPRSDLRSPLRGPIPCLSHTISGPTRTTRGEWGL